jgi:hypothetical protein
MAEIKLGNLTVSFEVKRQNNKQEQVLAFTPYIRLIDTKEPSMNKNGIIADVGDVVFYVGHPNRDTVMLGYWTAYDRRQVSELCFSYIDLSKSGRRCMYGKSPEGNGICKHPKCPFSAKEEKTE